MKKVRYLFCVLSIVFLSSCGFVNYVDTSNHDTLNSEQESGLENLRENYIIQLTNLSSDSNYEEKERKIYMKFLMEAKSEINECDSLEVIKEIYDKYAKCILELKTKEQYAQELQDMKLKYIELLNSVSDEVAYREKELAVYKECIAQGTHLLNDLNQADEEVFQQIYEVYREAILEIKTNELYIEEEKSALMEYQKDNIKIITDYLNLQEYRQSEIDNIQTILSEYIDKINQCENVMEIDNYVREYKIKVYSFKTDKELYAEELELLKENSKNEIDFYKNSSIYRENEQIILNSIKETFNTQVVSCQTKEDVLTLVLMYQKMMDSIKNDEQLYEEERLLLIEESYNEMLILVDMQSMNEEAQKEYLEYCENVKTEMLTLKTKELVKSRLSYEKQNIYLLGAQLGDKSSLMELQSLLIEDLNNYLDSSLYREEQQSEILKIINDQGKNIKSQENYADTLSAVENAKVLLDKVLTNNQIWEQEDKDFFVRLHELYGNDILIPQTSLTEADNYMELAKIIDYYAFYQLDRTSFVRSRFRVKLNFAYDSLQEIHDNLTKQYCELAKYMISLRIYNENEFNIFVFSTPYQFAINDSIEEKREILNSNVQYESNKEVQTKRTSEFNNFKYLSSSKIVRGIWNSQQLWYALEHDYIPICVKDSVAEKCLNRGKEILIDIITDEMDDGEKIFQIYTWLAENVQFTWTFNDKVCDKSSYIEGALFNGFAKCRGFAKTYLMLLKMEGIEAYLSYQYNSDHEFVLINYKDKFYISDITYATYRSPYFVSYKYLLMENKINNPLYSSLPFSSELPDLYENLKIDNINVYNPSLEDVSLILQTYSQKENFVGCINFYFADEAVSDIEIPSEFDFYISNTYHGEYSIIEYVCVKSGQSTTVSYKI